MTAPAEVAALRPIALAELDALAPLTLRVCRKYVVPAPLLPVLVERLAPDHGVLCEDGRTSFAYSSTYLDTPDLLTLRQHRQGRRRRFKIRTRSYLDSGATMMEVKLRGRRGVADKRRTVHDGRPGELTAAAEAFLRRTLDGYGAAPPGRLRATASTDYRRTTLVALSGRERITYDTDLVCTHAGQSVAMRRDLVLVEVKTLDGPTGVERLLRGHGLRPVSFSKYVAAVAVVNPGVRANRWHRVLRQCFGHL